MAADAIEPSGLVLLIADDMVKDGVMSSWVLASRLKKKITYYFILFNEL